MLEKVIKLLNKYEYKIDYTSYHIDEDIKKYSEKKDKVNYDKFLTIFTPDGYVVGRILPFKKGMEFKGEHLERIISFFEIFEIKDNKEIVENLKKLNSNSYY